jgi:hypothetical protein
MTQSYQPFPITEQKTGLNNFLQPWIRPIDAFDPLENGYIYRGVLQRREGYTFLGTLPASTGRLSYRDYLATGGGGKVYSGTLSTVPILAGSFNPTDGIESFTDDGLGVLTGSAGGTGTINYTTGAWTLNFNANVVAPTNIYVTYIPLLSPARPIMGLLQYTNETTDLISLVALDTRRAALFNNITQVFTPISTMSQTLWIDDGVTASITLATNFAAVAPYTQALVPNTVTVSYAGNTMTDNGAGGFPGAGVMLNTSTVNYATGVIVLNLSANSLGRVFTVTANLQGDYFTGNYSNFFNSTNWLSNLYMVNNKDPITTFDGANLGRRPFSITLANYTAFINNIGTCLDVDVYKNRFLAIRPTIINATGQNGLAAQSIRWSQLNVPNNMAADASGNGGELSAPTDDFIKSAEFLRDQLVLPFTNSFWTFRFTGSDFNPFRFDKINTTKTCQAPYATVPYDERITAIGSKGHVACDGVNVQRYDIPIIDQFEEINQNYFEQCFALRFDTMNQTWIIYPRASDSTNTPPNTDILIYNFLENTWANFKTHVSMSCLGLFFYSSDALWQDFAAGQPLGDLYPSWAEAEFNWDYFSDKKLEPQLLAGGSDGVVYTLYEGTEDNGFPFTATFKSTQWNPFSKIGQQVQFGYIDFYYIKNDEAQFELTFYVDNSEAPAAVKTLTLDGTTSSNKNLKRVYINTLGSFLQMEMKSLTQETAQIIGIVLWARPAGRFTP